jgi:hypothetical protein
MNDSVQASNRSRKTFSTRLLLSALKFIFPSLSGLHPQYPSIQIPFNFLDSTPVPVPADDAAGCCPFNFSFFNLPFSYHLACILFSPFRFSNSIRLSVSQRVGFWLVAHPRARRSRTSPNAPEPPNRSSDIRFSTHYLYSKSSLQNPLTLASV